MAPIKRTRTVDEPQFEILEEASSSLRRDSNKRPRLSGADASDDDFDRESTVYPSTQYRSHPGVREAYERERDAVSDVSGDEEERAMEMATQAIKKRKMVNTENVEPEQGVLESIICTNFMCHRKLEVHFGPLINFIIGHNGSGKSAVLTAITLCLGGKATATNRGQSLKSFIKEGEESANLQVKIKNRGDNSYKHSQYGDSITIERLFSQSGVSGFKIRNANGKVIATKRAEVDEITDFYALQLDNPVNVLSQDAARQFLNASTAHDKYKFFLKGTMLEQLDNDYVVLADTLDQTEAQIGGLIEQCGALKSKRRQAEEKQQLSVRQQTLRERITATQRKVAWSQVEEQEKNLSDLEAHAETVQARIRQREQVAQEASDVYEEADRVHREGHEAPDRLREELDPLKALFDEAHDAFSGNKAKLESNQVQGREMHEERKQTQNEITSLRTAILAEEEKLANNVEAGKVSELEEATVSLEDLRRKLNEHLLGEAQLGQEKATSLEQQTSFEPGLAEKRNEIQQAETRLHDLTRDKNTQRNAFQTTLPNLLRAIDNDNRYARKPVGPIGMHVRLLDPDWSSVIERVFGQNLNAFVVTSKHDQVLLSETMRKVQCVYPVMIGSATRLDVTAIAPDEQYTTILRVLDIDDEAIRNQLIINNGIDQTIIIRDSDEAFRIMFQQSPRNVKACIGMHPTKRGWGIRYSTNRGNDKSDPVRAWDQSPPRMRTDIEAQIRMQRETVQTLKQELTGLEAEYRRLKNHVVNCGQAVEKHRRTTSNSRLQIDRTREQMEKLEDEIANANKNGTTLPSLKSDLVDAEDKLLYWNRQIEIVKEAREDLALAGVDLKRQLDDTENQCDAKKEEIEAANNDLVRLGTVRAHALRKKNEAVQRIADTKQTETECQAECDRQSALVADFIEKATAICDRVTIERGMTTKKYEDKLDRLELEARRFEQQIGGTELQILEEAVKAKQAHLAAENELQSAQNLIHKLMGTLQERRQRWEKFRSFISIRARSGFTYFLSERAFRGRMIIDHKRKALSLEVEPDMTRKVSRAGPQGRQTKTLSGGEKSFSTLSMLLSLWDSMGSPIRCLDEFDVFMDSVNREISMRMLVSAARGGVGRQYILITPQAMGNDLGPDVKIHRMRDPERGQTTLNIEGA